MKNGCPTLGIRARPKQEKRALSSEFWLGEGEEKGEL